MLRERATDAGQPGAVVGGFDREEGVLVHVEDRDLEIDLVVPVR